MSLNEPRTNGNMHENYSFAEKRAKDLDEKLITNNMEPDQQEKSRTFDKLLGKEEDNINIRAAVIHILGDMVQSIGVISAAIIIKIRPDW